MYLYRGRYQSLPSSGVSVERIEDIGKVVMEFSEMDNERNLTHVATVLPVQQLEDVYPLQKWLGDPKSSRVHWIMN